MWISIHDTVFGSKLMGLSKALGCSRNEALGLLVTFWLCGAKNANPDGMILNYDKDDIARELIAGLDERYTGKQAVEAMIASGWLDDFCGYLYIHDWAEHQQPMYSHLSMRENNRKNQAKHRERQRAEAAADTSPPPQAPPMPQNVSPSDSSDGKATNPPSVHAKKATNAYSTGFEEFWAVYPRKEGKGEAYKCYNARLNDGWNPQELLEAARNYAADVQKRHTERMYIKHPKTFLSATTPFTDFISTRVPGGQEQIAYNGDEYGEWRQ